MAATALTDTLQLTQTLLIHRDLMRNEHESTAVLRNASAGPHFPRHAHRLLIVTEVIETPAVGPRIPESSEPRPHAEYSHLLILEDEAKPIVRNGV